MRILTGIAAKLDKWCVDEWRQAHRWWSVRCTAGFGALAALWPYAASAKAAAASAYPYLTEVLPYIPADVPRWMVVAACVVIIVARMAGQKS